MGSNNFHSASAILERKYFDVEPINKRIKVYQLPEEMDEQYLEELKTVAKKVACDKIIFYTRSNTEEESRVQRFGSHFEGEIKGFLNGEDAKVYSFYVDPIRNQADPDNVISRVKQLTLNKPTGKVNLEEGYTMIWAKEEHAEDMATLYRSVFDKYPTPIDDPNYIIEMMKSDVCFSLIYSEDELVSACSADIFTDFNAAEFTDCATLPSQRGKGLLSYQYPFLEKRMKELGIGTMFSYTRATSMGMNIVAAQQGFTYGGCMVQNSMIGTGIEDMNIWYKQL
ncbi:putative beta-lysine N-acetyltransferase [Pontibacillus yanchengensis]|uniref:Putative beta-lysine N-acetyltransferase n=1 Tax=Pontibacillus yanchengensis TaxID=462910 RepID=A0A6I5A301_9BACI|nr:putative beta-lysine N-acetyltransferase [Pontibacillus yanchengensis]MYL32539.1 putative beta-lysine N-acetyltransferase [Pontibacillus yanchengensis]